MRASRSATVGYHWRGIAGKRRSGESHEAARERNFYNRLACRYGDEDAAKTIQDLYLSGRKAEAEAAVPDRLVDDVALCGPRERIRERLGQWTSAGVTTLMVGGDVTALRVMAELTL